MILKEFEQKLKTFLESGNTGKYKLRITGLFYWHNTSVLLYYKYLIYFNRSSCLTGSSKNSTELLIIKSNISFKLKSHAELNSGYALYFMCGYIIEGGAVWVFMIG